jgi:hypothetical protein
MSTNGAELTPDLANRAIVVKIKKQPHDYEFQKFPEGDLLAHVKANRDKFLGAVFAVIQAWILEGKPTTNESRHTFKEWVRALDWIVQHIFRCPPLLDGHREDQHRICSPGMQWLRDCAIAVERAGKLGEAMQTSVLVELASDDGHDLPGNDKSDAVRAGKLLGKIWANSDSDIVVVDGFHVRRTEKETDTGHGLKPTKFYAFSRP